MPNAMTSLHQKLRSATAPWHRALDRDLDLSSPRFTLEMYTTLLERFLSFYQPWERTALPDLAKSSATLTNREKTPWLLHDLSVLGKTNPEVPAADLPPHGTRGQRLGTLYVLEGATLGGQFLAPALEQRFHWDPGYATRFYRSYGPDTKARWALFLETLESYSSPQDDAEIVESAMTTFKTLYHCLCPSQPTPPST